MQVTTGLPLLLALGARVFINTIVPDPTHTSSTPDFLLNGLFQGVLIHNTLTQIPQAGPPTLTCAEQVAPASTPTQRCDGCSMRAQFARDTHGVEIPDDHGPVDAPRGQVVAMAVES